MHGRNESPITPAGLAAAAGALLGALLLAATAAAAPPPPFEAGAGVALASEAAHAWANDAALIYVENDEDVNASGQAGRWGYLFYSATSDKARAYTVRDGRILAAENLDMKFVAPPVPTGWMDSGAALAAAEREVGAEFRTKHAGRLGTMLLMRGAFDADDPNRTTWLFVYVTPSEPSLFVVVDAADGKVRRTWRG